MNNKVNRALVAKKMYVTPLVEVVKMRQGTVLMSSPIPPHPAPRRPHGGDIIP